MHDPLLGELSPDKYGQLVSEPRAVAFLGGRLCRFEIDAGELARDDVRAAIQNTLDASTAMLDAAEPHVIQYCDEILGTLSEDERPRVMHVRPGEIWSHVQFGKTMSVRRRAKGDADDGVYLSLECNCDWEPEHGLEIVVRDGLAISKVGPFDGHVTNTDAYDDPGLTGVVYRSFR